MDDLVVERRSRRSEGSVGDLEQNVLILVRRERSRLQQSSSDSVHRCKVDESDAVVKQITLLVSLEFGYSEGESVFEGV